MTNETKSEGKGNAKKVAVKVSVDTSGLKALRAKVKALKSHGDMFATEIDLLESQVQTTLDKVNIIENIAPLLDERGYHKITFTKSDNGWDMKASRKARKSAGGGKGNNRRARVVDGVEYASAKAYCDHLGHGVGSDSAVRVLAGKGIDWNSFPEVS